MNTQSKRLIAPSAPETTRRRRLLALAAFCLLATLAWGAYWLLVARFEVGTDNAYVQGNVVHITPQAGGTVIAIGASDTDEVKAGQLLVRLDAADARVALDAAEAQLGQTVREVRATFTTNKALGATIAGREAEVARSENDLSRLRADLARREALVEGGAVSREELQHLQSAVARARLAQSAAAAGLAEAREQLMKNESLTDGTRVEAHPRVLAAAAKYREAWLGLKRCEIVAPVAGTVARRSVQLGQRVASGTPLMAIVPLDELWVDANFKESQLARLRVGQPVRLSADVYGGRTDYRGRIVGLGAGTGSAFSLLPAQNATGNWIKIVQRVPVRIALEAKALAEHPLRVGLSMDVVVDIRDESGAPVEPVDAGKGPASSTPVFDALGAAADERVNAIVSQHLGSKVRVKRAA